MANNFLKYKKINIGKSIFEKNSENIFEKLINLSIKSNCNLYFPEDVNTGKHFNDKSTNKKINEIENDDIILDIGDKTILCSGTVLGSYKKMKEYLNLIKNNIAKFKYKKKLKYLLTLRIDPEGRGCDQGHANYLVHKDLIKNIHCYSNSDGPFATVFYLKKITFDKNSRLLNNSGNPYLLVHQYDKRWQEFSKQVEEIKGKL